MNWYRIPTLQNQVCAPQQLNILTGLRKTIARNIRCHAFIALALAAIFFASEASAQAGTHFTVTINGAGQFTALLNDFLDIRKHESDTNLSVEELQRLVGSAPQQIRELLATEGYFSPAVASEIQQADGQQVVRLNIALGAPTEIGTIDIRFRGDIAEGPHADSERIERLRRLWLLQPGALFRQTTWNDAKNALLKDLLNHDYPAAKILQSEARIDPEKHAAVLSVELDSGPLFTFGSLQIQGLKRYSRTTIDPLNPIQPGEAYSQEKLTELQARLQDSGYFRSAFATIEVDPEHPHDVPVHLDLTENERRRLALGVGFSTDTGARLQVKWFDRSFFGGKDRLEAAIRVDRQSQLAGADLYLPALDNGWRPSLGTHFERTDIANEIDDKIRFDARVTSPMKADEKSYGVSYLAERDYVADAYPNNRQALIATATYTRRRVDNLISPHRGYVASLELSGGPKGIINEANIARVVGRVNWLSPVRSRWQLVARGEIGQVMGAGRDAVPSDLLFRTGGDQTVRGYAFNSLGISENGAIVGGRTLAIVSAELVYKLTPTWGAAVFQDAGNAADTWRGFRFKQGTGIGARWASPIGPVNIDLAYGHAVHQPRLHFSVGYGF